MLLKPLVFLAFLCIVVACNGPAPEPEAYKVPLAQLSKQIIPDLKVDSSDSLLTRTSDGILNFGNNPFSGTLVSSYPSGQLKTEHEYYLGKQEGKARGYHPDGSRESLRYYRNGEKVGEHKGWYANGQIKFKYYFVNGLTEGKQMDWYENGDVFKETNFRNGQPFGAQKKWRDDGKLRSNFVITEDGKRYGLAGVNRCVNIDTENEEIKSHK